MRAHSATSRGNVLTIRYRLSAIRFPALPRRIDGPASVCNMADTPSGCIHGHLYAAAGAARSVAATCANIPPPNQ
jgi:hypothetical protein